MAKKICKNNPDVSIKCPPGYVPCCSVKGSMTHTACLTTTKPTGRRGPTGGTPIEASATLFVNSVLEFLETHGNFPGDVDDFIDHLKEALMDSGARLVIGDQAIVFHPDEDLRIELNSNWNKLRMKRVWRKRFEDIQRGNSNSINPLRGFTTWSNIEFGDSDSNELEM